MKKEKILYLLFAVVLVGVLFLSFQGKEKEEDVIKVGAVLPLTGPIALSGGEQCRIGMKIAEEEINSTGGIDGKQVKILLQDSMSDNLEGVNSFKNIVQFQSPVIMVTMGSGLSMSLSPLAKEYEIPLLATIATTPLFTKQNEFSFRYYSTTEKEVEVLIEIINKKDINKIGVLYINDDFGNAMVSDLEKQFSGIVFSDSFNITDTDFRTKITKIKSKNPEGLLVVGFADHTINLLSQIKEFGMDELFLFSSSLATIPEVKRSIGELNLNVFVPAPKTYKKIDTFETRYLIEQFNQFKGISKVDFDHYVVSCYDTINIIKQVLKESNEQDFSDFKKILTDLESFKGQLGETINSEREINFPLFPAEIKDNKINYLFSE